MKFIKKWFLFILIAANLIATIIFYNRLPDTIPYHWSIAGAADAYGPRPTIFVLAFMPLIIYFFMVGVSMIDPKKHAYQNPKYKVLATLISLLFVGISAYVLFTLLNPDVNGAIVATALMFVFEIIFGNFISTLKQNFFVGVRVPWTLSSPQNWDKTHRFYGKALIIAGLISLCVLYFSRPVAIFIAIFLPFTAFIYSFYLYKKGI